MKECIHNCPELIDTVERLGFLPLLESGVPGFSADGMVVPECRYRVTDEGWDWPLWEWKGPAVTEGGFAYGKFFDGKAGFVSKEWWPDLCNYRRSVHPEPSEESIEGTILEVLRLNGSMITRDLRSACGFDGPKMRGRFDSYVTRLENACRVVIEDFVYPQDKHGHRYGWGWALLNTPERLFGREACRCNRSPEESRSRIVAHLRRLLPKASDRQLDRIVG